MTPEMVLEAPTLRVRDLPETLSFYEEGMGLKTISSHADETDGLRVVELGTPRSRDPLVILKEDPGAHRPSPDFAGLYHYAVLLPSRRSLASTYLALGGSGIPFDGYADHHVSEALYLHDAEANGIEVYADRPRETWSSFRLDLSSDRVSELRRLAMLNRPLDFTSLLRELTSAERASPETFADGARIGHMHLRVTDLQRSVKFYHEVMGLDVMVNTPENGIAFLSVGGYHHHLGLNTWQSRGGTPHREGDAGLDRFAISVPRAGFLDALQSNLGTHDSPFVRDAHGIVASDPDGNLIEVRTRDEKN